MVKKVNFCDKNKIHAFDSSLRIGFYRLVCLVNINRRHFEIKIFKVFFFFFFFFFQKKGFDILCKLSPDNYHEMSKLIICKK